MAQQTLPEGVSILPGELKRIADAMDALDKDNHAPHQIQVTASLHVHHEYPKHIQISDKELVVVNDAQEELDAIEKQLLATKSAGEAKDAASLIPAGSDPSAAVAGAASADQGSQLAPSAAPAPAASSTAAPAVPVASGSSESAS